MQVKYRQNGHSDKSNISYPIKVEKWFRATKTFYVCHPVAKIQKVCFDCKKPNHSFAIDIENFVWIFSAFVLPDKNKTKAFARSILLLAGVYESSRGWGFLM